MSRFQWPKPRLRPTLFLLSSPFFSAIILIPGKPRDEIIMVIFLLDCRPLFLSKAIKTIDNSWIKTLILSSSPKCPWSLKKLNHLLQSNLGFGWIQSANLQFFYEIQSTDQEVQKVTYCIKQWKTCYFFGWHISQKPLR